MNFTQGMRSTSKVAKKKYTNIVLSDEQINNIKSSGDKGFVIKYNMFEVIVGYYFEKKIVLNYFHSYQQYNEV